jgi:hypothetical protein
VREGEGKERGRGKEGKGKGKAKEGVATTVIPPVPISMTCGTQDGHTEVVLGAESAHPWYHTAGQLHFGPGQSLCQW